ncbi:MAG: NrtA/SsuA/CpmA family ABC transporter substrate-binding protein [Chloroflexi bacterium]|nr:NrtA/SsuA/CpmA family ABC transporter substrate-binding protein [Chloroflexota bacterium]
MKRFNPVSILLAGILATIFVFLACTPKYTGPVESINFGTVPTASTTLIYIAQEQRFFEANGLSINITDYNTGVATTEALLKGDTDISWVAEFPFVKRAFAKENISIIAVISRFNEQHLFSRRDRGIENITDLKGKKIGIPLNTIAEFYLGRFLELNGMSIKDVSLIDVTPSQAIDAITSGSIDGVVVWEPYSSQIKERLAGSTAALPIQSGQPGYGLITARNDWINEHPELVKRFLKSLAQAQDFIARNPSSAKAIIRTRLNFDDAFTETIWAENQFSIALDQSLIIAMEDEARWLISSNQTGEKEVPNFLDYIYADSLKSVKPAAVRIAGK